MKEHILLTAPYAGPEKHNILRRNYNRISPTHGVLMSLMCGQVEQSGCIDRGAGVGGDA